MQKITKVYNRILYPRYCYACPHLEEGKYFHEVEECDRCETLAQYGIYKTPAGKMYAFKDKTPYSVKQDND